MRRRRKRKRMRRLGKRACPPIHASPSAMRHCEERSEAIHRAGKRPMDCFAYARNDGERAKRSLPFSPCGRRWIDRREAAARRMRGLSPHEGSVTAERTPHPALRATFSHKGRREERRRIRAHHCVISCVTARRANHSKPVQPPNKNIPLRAHPKSPLQLRPSRAHKRGVSRSSRTLGAGSGGRGSPGAQEVFAG